MVMQRQGHFLLIVFLFSFMSAWPQAPTKDWDRTFGGTSVDQLLSFSQTTDGGFVLGGTSNSIIGWDKTGYKGIYDYWIVKTDSIGVKQWDGTYGTSGSDVMAVVKQTYDGGFILGGSSSTGINQDKTDTSRGNMDYWIVKVDSVGNLLWDVTIGGSDYDGLSDIAVTNDHGYILGGSSRSGISGEKSDTSRGTACALCNDYWIVKLDSNGTIEWDKTYGGKLKDDCQKIIQTSDGGYLAGGFSYSGVTGDRTQPGWGDMDYWIVKMDANGNKQWDKRYGGTGKDYFWDVIQSNDGGYLMGGGSGSGATGDKCEPSRGLEDFWAVKIDSSGEMEWNKTFGYNSWDYIQSVQQTSDGGYLLGGGSESNVGGEKSEDLKIQDQDPGQGENFWVVKVDARGKKLWDKTVGSFNGTPAQSFYREEAYGRAYQTKEGGYIVGGSSSGPIGADKTDDTRGLWDFWIIKLNNDESVFNTVNYEDTLDYYICNIGDSVQLNIGGYDSDNYQWLPASSLSNDTIKSPFAYPDSNTLYKLAISAACVNVDTLFFEVSLDTNEVSAQVAFSDTTVCSGESVQLIASGGASYSWIVNNNLDSLKIATPVATPIISTIYKVVAFSDGGCKSDTAETSVEVVSYPVFSIEEPIICKETEEVLVLQTDASTVIWFENSDSNEVGTGNSLTVNLEDSTLFYVQGYSNIQCVALDSFYINVIECYDIFITNAFSPNNDGVNDFFEIHIPDNIELALLRVFDKFGTKLFETTDPGIAWDGKHNTKLQPQGTYVYMFEAEDITNEKKISQKGNLILIW